VEQKGDRIGDNDWKLSHKGAAFVQMVEQEGRIRERLKLATITRLRRRKERREFLNYHTAFFSSNRSIYLFADLTARRHDARYCSSTLGWAISAPRS